MAKQKKAPPDQPALDHIAEALRPLAVPVGDLVLDPANARVHGEENLSAVRASLRVYGQRKPIVANKQTGAVEAGNGTLSAAISLGWSHVAVVWVDDDPTTAAGYSITDNRTSDMSLWDRDALDALLRTVQTGDDELAAMLAKLAEEEGIVLPEESAAGADAVQPPEEFPAYGEDISTDSECPKCGYKWSSGK